MTARYLQGRIALYFLPPYSPDYNRIERVWEDLHANVTRNHACPDIASLMRAVRYYLRKRNLKLVQSASPKTRERAAA
jgi:transposase